MKIGIAIPTFKKHLQYLDRLLTSIEAQTIKPDLVAVSASGCKDSDINISQYSFPIQIVTTMKNQNASTNRNIAGNILLKEHLDIISFIDGDDEMFPERTEFIQRAFTDGAQIVMHYFIMIRSPTTPVKRNNIDYIAFPNSLRTKKIGVTCSKGSLTHGHVSVHAKVFEQEQFMEERCYEKWEDSEYCNRIISKGFPNCYIPTALTIYHKY